MGSSLSILITYYNEKALLTECLRSILSQKPGPEEFLIYDDASQYPARDYLISDPRIRVIRGEKNEGPSFGRNVLLREATGGYVHFHDADDWFNPNWSLKVRGGMEGGNVDAIFTEVASYSSIGRLHTENVLGVSAITDQESLVRFCIRRFMLVPAGTFKTSFVREQGGYRTDLWQSEDFEFNIRMALHLRAFLLIPEALVSIRLREESRSRNKVQTTTDALKTLLQMQGTLPTCYRQDLSEKAAILGRQLYALGEREKAAEAFNLAHSLGPPQYEDEGPLYRILAKLCGQASAEGVGAFYRKVFPTLLRKRLRL